jgi:site-specific recombinase XerD
MGAFGRARHVLTELGKLRREGGLDASTRRRRDRLRCPCLVDGARCSTVTAKILQRWMAVAQKRAGLRATGALHLLRHTFCSHLAMRSAPALSIQKLAGHEDLSTTLGYMHLAEGETERVIRLLDERGYGNLTATEDSAVRNVVKS